MEQKNTVADKQTAERRKFHFDYPWLSAAVPLVVLMIVLPIANPRFLTVSNLTGVLVQAAVYVIMALGMSFVLMTGGIDLSQGSLLALVGVVAAYIVGHQGSIILAIIASLLVGALVGLATGTIISCLKIPPFIMPGIPVPVIIFIIAAVVGQFILSYTATGRYILAVGSNREAARLSGIKTRWNECKVYIISGIMVSIAGIVYVARLGAAQANAGQSYEMEAVAASVLGGTSVLGGEGGIIGTVLGAIVVAIIRNAIVLLEISTYYQQMITGAVILLAVIVDVQRKAAAAKRVD